MTQPTNSIDNELEAILNYFQLEVESWNIGQPTHKTMTKGEALQAIKALYRKEIEEAINSLDPDSYEVKTLRAKLLPPTKGGKDE